MGQALTVALLVAGGLAAGYIIAALLLKGRSRPAVWVRPALIVLGGAVGLYLAYAVAGPARTEAATSPGQPVTVLATAEQFDEAMERATTPVLVDFYADWCGPCQQLAPVLEQLHAEWAGKVAFYKVNVDKSPDLAQRFSIEGLPTLVFFHHGEEVDRILGAPARDDLVGALHRHASHSAS